jgi:hypothetical protein
MKPPADRTARILLPLVTGCLLVAFWYAVKAVWNLHDFILPAPHDVVFAFHEEADTLWRAGIVTFLGALAGFTAAVALGFALSLDHVRGPPPTVRTVSICHLHADDSHPRDRCHCCHLFLTSACRASPSSLF